MTNQKHIARKIEADEWQKYKKIRLEALKNDPHAFGSSYKEEIKRTDDEWKNRAKSASADNSKKMFVGIPKNDDEFLAIGGAYTENNPEEWHIMAIYVSPEHRGQGIGKVLMDEIIKVMKSRGDVKRLILRVNVAQEAAVHLYRSFGFKIVDTLKNESFGGCYFYDEYEMMLDI